MKQMPPSLRCPKHDASLVVRHRGDLHGERLQAFVREHQGCGPLEGYDGAEMVRTLTFPASLPN